MGTRGRGYGSEDHLRRWLQADPKDLSSRLLDGMDKGAAVITWSPYPPRRSAAMRDRELTSIEFLDRTSNPHVYRL